MCYEFNIVVSEADALKNLQIGCYKDDVSDRDLPHYAKNNLSYAEKRTFTPKTCIEYCREKERLTE